MPPTYQIGVLTNPGDFGLIQNFSEDEDATKVEEKDADGSTAFVDHIDLKATAECEYVFDTTKTAPTVGSVLTIDTVKWYVDKVGKTQTNGGTKRLKLSLSRYIDNTLPAAT